MVRSKKPVSVTHPHLMEEWDFEKNSVRPEEVTYGSRKGVYWVCKDCGHVWKARVSHRTGSGSNCPSCSSSVVTKNNSLYTKYICLCKEWDYNKNRALTPDKVSYGSGKKVWWKCIVCGHSWRAFIYNRTCYGKGCPSCAGNVVSDNNRLSINFPLLSREFDCGFNGGLSSRNIAAGSNKSVWWLCNKCGHRWKARVNDRTRKVGSTGCPYCSGKLVTDSNSLSKNYKELLEEWDYIKNGELCSDDVSYGSDKRVWWLCKECLFSWCTSVSNRSIHKSGCPACCMGPISRISQDWLSASGIYNREYHIKELNIRVDGFDPKTNTVYEFLGDFWHGNPEVFEPKEINPLNKKSFGQLNQETMERIDLLKENGYSVVFVWESDYKNGIMESKSLNE